MPQTRFRVSIPRLPFRRYLVQHFSSIVADLFRNALVWSIAVADGKRQPGYWFNFGGGWCHLANDDPAQMLTGAAPRILYDSVAGHWKLVIEATMFVTYAVVNVWTV